MFEKPNYYAIIPADIRYDNELKPNEKLLFGEITSLSNSSGECWATNGYFANLYGVEVTTISRWISNLRKREYLEVNIEYKKGTKEIEKRVLILKSRGIAQKVNRYCSKSQGGIAQKSKENNTSINIKEINNNKLLFTKKSFQKPTFNEVNDYCLERKNNIDAQYFIDFYESKGWLIGKTVMKDWKACIRTWERNKKKTSENKKETSGERFARLLREAEEEANNE